MEIKISKEQLEKFENWKKSFGKLPYIGSTGGHFGLNITFTSIGYIVIAYNWKGDKLYLTEYEKF
jgi:hypothetical protein